MKQDDLFLTITWSKEDIFEVFKKKGIPMTQENFLKLKELRGDNTLLERSIDDGWEMLHIIVDSFIEEFTYRFVIIEHQSIPYVLTYKVLENYCDTELGCDVGEFLEDYTWDACERLIDHLNLNDNMCRASISDTHLEYVTWIYHNGDSEDILTEKAKFLFEWLDIEIDGSIELENH
ncbi:MULTISPECIES: hypothetical protein [Bacillus amyloliquefaciens group]|uniref:hypothetical protein n=1 Tax=Bacillus amyloliquefaciens group TaxID=1938374 RepID=UPI000E274C89|nr:MULTISPECIES: hypothetical protein [Bacillus amyloliquefaciens group]RDY83161.1 hypothetical protein C3733_20090 [Bacillus amyloliquefaciens]WFP05519.1 hypothetical protein JEQ22_20120 [Bacillus velezensis]